MEILSIPELLALMRRQADLRAPENDEAGCILWAAQYLELQVKTLEDRDEDGNRP